MRLVYGYALAVAAVMSAPNIIGAQQAETARSVAGGGITAAGWTGKVDANEEKNGQTVNNAKLAMEGKDLHVTTGPATTYWNPANKAAGNYTVKATFTEAKYMNLNDHPHPYGIMIAGNDLGTPQQSYLYCAAYGNGNFIVRGFGPEAFQVNGRRGESQRGRYQSRRSRRVRQAGDRGVRQGRQGGVLDQRHRCRELRQGDAGDDGQAEVDRRHLRHPLRAQHGRHRHRPDDDEELRCVAPGLSTRRSL